MNRKFLFAALIAIVTVFGVSAQDYIKPINGRGFFGTVINESNGFIKYISNRSSFQIPKEEIILIEYIERGVVVYNKEYIKPLNVSNYSGLLYARGNNVYVPLASRVLHQRSGAIALKELLMGDNFWNIVDCEEEAHCIIEYVFDSSGRDTAYIQIKDRNGSVLYTSSKVRCKGLVPTRAAAESAKKLFDNIIKKKIQKQ